MLQITRPTLLLDEKKVRQNIREMAVKASKTNVVFRPHFKTHQSIEIGRWFREFGVDRITVSSLEMARYFAQDGWQDILVAVPVNILQHQLINQLAAQINLHLVFDSIEAIEALESKLEKPVKAWIKVNTGYNRAGIDQFDLDLIIRSIEKINASQLITFEGLLSHSGHSYDLRNYDDIENVRKKEADYFALLKNSLRQRNFLAKISIGDTPTCSYMDEFDEVDEIRPGNFVFYDMVQEQIGSCKENQIAVAVACPVIGKYENRNQLLLYAGAVHLSKDSLIDSDGKRVFAYVAFENGTGWGDVIKSSPITSISQEVCKWYVDTELMKKVSIGDVVYLLPAHSCLTADLYPNYLTLDGTRISKFVTNGNC
ncbi:MAG: alanine racemase [Calditrichaeota bacterium]|nr:alanine racemase [Calditrichota bacterium]